MNRSLLRILGGWTACVFAICFTESFALPLHAQTSPSLAQADRSFLQKSYAAALKGYERAGKAGQVPTTRKDEVAYRIAVCLGKSQQWDRALARSLEFVQ